MLSETQLDFVEGALLGDGSLIMHKGGINAYFTYSSKHKDHVEYIFQQFKEFCNYSELKFTEYFDKRTNKIYSRYYFRTKCIPIFTEIYLIWYKNNKKCIPQNLILTRLKILIWYIGDGSLSKKEQMIKLSTDCFSRHELEQTIIPQLVDFAPVIYENNTYPRIYIPRVKVHQFLKHIGNCPIDSYLYKWDYINYKNELFKSDKVLYTTETAIDQYIELYEKGWSYYKIAKFLKVEANRVKYHLERKNVYCKGRDLLKRKISEKEIEQIKDLREKNISWRDINKIYGVSRQNFSHYVKKNKNNLVYIKEKTDE